MLWLKVGAAGNVLTWDNLAFSIWLFPNCPRVWRGVVISVNLRFTGVRFHSSPFSATLITKAVAGTSQQCHNSQVPHLNYSWLLVVQLWGESYHLYCKLLGICVFHYLSRSIFFAVSFFDVVEACLHYIGCYSWVWYLLCKIIIYINICWEVIKEDGWLTLLNCRSLSNCPRVSW